jgi:hypothetical protein
MRAERARAREDEEVEAVVDDGRMPIVERVGDDKDKAKTESVVETPAEAPAETAAEEAPAEA